MPTLATITDFLHRFAPLELAESWDNVGLLLGDTAAEVQKIMTCLTVTPASAAEAVEDGAQLIVTHHPVLYRPTQRITSEAPEGRLLLSLMKAGVAVYSPHTAFDNCAGGINDILCRRLGLQDVQPLRRFDGPRQCKIVVFVPESDLAHVSDALFKAGAGHIGQYSQCSFRLAGTGTFFGSEETNPAIGQKGRREEVAEWRLEVICPESRVAEAVTAMRKAHSYEEPAFDVYPLRPVPSGLGAGRIGSLPQAVILEDLASTAKTALNSKQVQVVGEPGRSIRRVAVVCGSGGEFVEDCVRAGADVFLTGEMRFHNELAAEAHGLAVVLAGHYATERLGIEELAGILAREFPSLHVWPSRKEALPAWPV